MRFVPPALAAVVAALPAGFAAQTPPASTNPLRDHYQAAQTFQLAGDLDRAEAEYSSEVIPRALRRLAALASAEGRQADARAHLEEARGRQPANLDVALDLVVVLLRAGERESAAGLAREAVVAHPDHARALRLHGKALLTTGDNAGARAALERSMAIAADFDTALTLAYANLRTRRVTEARALFDEMVARSPSAEVRSLIARAYLENDLPGPAAAHLEQALTLDAAHEPSRTLLASVKAGRPVDRAALPTVLLQEPPARDEERGARLRQQITEVLANSYFNLGVIHSRRGRPADAVAALARARAWKADLEGIDRAEGIALFYADRFAEAIPPLERHLSAFPADEAARKLLDASYVMTGTRAGASSATGQAAGAVPPPSDVDRLVAELAAGPADDTEPKLWALLAREPANARALGLLGRLLLSTNRPAEAEAIFRRATEVAASDREAWLGRAKALALTGRASEARGILEAAILRIPGDPRLEVELARVLVTLNDPRAALEHLSRVPAGARPPDAPGIELAARIALGETATTRDLAVEAATSVDEATAVLLMNLLLQHARPSEARSLGDAVRARGLQSAPLLVAGARARLATGDRAGAEQWYEQALDADSMSVAALAGLGDLIAARDPTRATELFLIARSHGDRSPSLLRSLALSARAALRFTDAVEAASALAAIRPDDVEAVNLLGTIQLQAGDWPAAEQTFARMAVLDARDARAPLGLGIARYGQRRYADAEASFERSLALDARQGEAHYQLALVARDDGRSEVAIERLERAVALAPRHQAAHVTLGSLLVEAGEYERALPVLERAIGLGPTMPDPYYQLGLLFSRLKQPERARRAMEQFRRLRGVNK
jgi:tetratricopeptide (TPR) repeat protein